MYTVENRQEACTFCGVFNWGHEFETKDRWGKILKECKWSCMRCGQLYKTDIMETPREEPK